MPTVYRRTERIRELNGQVRDGITVVAHSPGDVLALEGLVDTVGQLPGDTLGNMYRVLASAGREPEKWPWAAGETSGNETTGAGPEMLDKHAASLRASLGVARRVWNAQGDDVGELALAMMLPRPGRRRAAYDTNRPALVLDYGSIRARVLAAGGVMKRFGVALFPMARSKRRANVVEALRDRAKGHRLPRLDTIQPADLADKTGVVIFLHGLMSTDVGTFDEFVTVLKAAPNFGHSLQLVAWPHDTLSSIDTNAEDLSDLVEEKLGGSQLPITFVCHSRGGLVARKTAVELMKADRERWKPRLRGLVTFGTPHKGAELAESGDELLGKLLLAYTVATRGGVVPLVDALWSVKDHKKLTGVTNLRPRSNGGSFLSDLRKAERDITKKAGGVPLRLYAVGGDTPSNNLGAKLSRRYFGGAAHDLIVTMESSVPNSAERRDETTCDHFSYFTTGEMTLHAKRAIDFLQETMATPAAQAPVSEVQTQMPVVVGKPLKVEARVPPPGAKREVVSG